MRQTPLKARIRVCGEVVLGLAQGKVLCQSLGSNLTWGYGSMGTTVLRCNDPSSSAVY